MLELEDQSPPPPPPPKNWFVGHPYATSSLGAILLFLVGAYIVLINSLASPPPPSVSAWGGTIGSLLAQNEYVPGIDSTGASEDILRQVQDSPPYSYKIPPLTPPDQGQTGTPQQPQDNNLDLKLLIASLGESETRVGAPPLKWTNVIYEFPPSSMFSSSEAPPKRSPLQQNLYHYGNEVGSYIQSFEQQNANQTQILKDQLEDRNSPEKAAAVSRLGRALQDIGSNIQGIEDVPLPIAEAHRALIDSYAEIGYNLTLVPAAKDNEGLLRTINTYNKSADVFAEKFVDMVNVFSKNNVVFATGDAGTVFTFTFSSDN